MDTATADLTEAFTEAPRWGYDLPLPLSTREGLVALDQIFLTELEGWDAALAASLRAARAAPEALPAKEAAP